MKTQLLRIGDDIVALHAVVTDEGVTLIDAGLPGDRRILRRALAAVGRDVSDIRGIVLTHGDSDHIGIAEWLRAEHGIPTFVHEADAGRAQGEKTPGAPGGRWRVGPTLQFLAVALRRGALRPRHLGAVRTVRDGDVLDLPGSPEIIGLPGHSPGSIAIRVPVADAIFVGDAVTTRHVLNGSAEVQVGPFSDDPDLTPESLERLRALPERAIVVGHGPIFRGTAADLLSSLGR
ncbi:MBL fold metallo-hydrolase [Microbacterium hydrocarbonoxydans]|uniref:MBL fold metallo-hydrolase n=1 Tax=Microbacterium hydrocarbonoxydans TaxID=273678 RepID=UPI0007BBE502|nr:MBL fold metallo-hydrolase [Microbacterium hydrocarbonoxydans]GAT73845.1 beta-lactamase domain-containing protein [Microbacterium sp. HM58-2]